MCTQVGMQTESRRGHQILVLQAAVSHHVGAGNHTRVFWKNSKRSLPLSHLSVFPPFYFYKYLCIYYYGGACTIGSDVRGQLCGARDIFIP